MQPRNTNERQDDFAYTSFLVEKSERCIERYYQSDTEPIQGAIHPALEHRSASNLCIESIAALSAGQSAPYPINPFSR